MGTYAEGTVLWEPPELLRRECRLADYLRWLAEQHGLRFDTYDALWHWSTREIPAFWQSIWQYFDLHAATPYEAVLASSAMPGACWFPGATLNYAEHAFRQASPARPALVFQGEGRPLVEMSWANLERSVGSLAAALRRMGVKTGDRVVAYMPNIPEAVIAFLACASVGAIWSSCSPDMGSASVVDRFKQIEPKVLFAVDGYRYGGKEFDRASVVRELHQALPSLADVVLIPYLDPEASPASVGGAVPWADLLAAEAALDPIPVPFDHPLWILYSSGTTGLPKPIVQGHGGIILEHVKVLALQHDMRAGDRLFWFTTTGWMMWNFLVGGLLVGATIVLYDGSPAWPDMDALWNLAEQAQITLFGTSAAYIAACMKANLAPSTNHDLSRLKAIGSTGSPLSVDGFAWVYERVKRDLWLASASGGTDLCTAFVGGSPLLPVRAGEIQCRCLGAAVAAFDEQGQAMVDTVGELVIAEPMPSMPLYFWNDPGGVRYRESYFEMFPGIWRHGDWIKVTNHGGVVIYGRSDATINRQGIRMGTSELYRVVEELPEVLDSLVVDLEMLGRPSFMPLFVVLRPGESLNDALIARIKGAIRAALSARYLPNEIYEIAEVPRTLSGKKMELPVKRILLGEQATMVANPDSMGNPSSIRFFVEMAGRLNG